MAFMISKMAAAQSEKWNFYEWFQLMEDIHDIPKWQSHEIITSHVDVPDKWVRQVLDSIYGYSGGYDCA